MKNLIISLILLAYIVVYSDTKDLLFIPHLPIGKFKTNFLGAMHCVTTQSINKINMNFYINKKSANTTEIKGNMTNLIPLDDSLDVNLSFAVKDSIGGWQENAFVFKSTKACSSLKRFLGNAWNQVMEGLGFKNVTSCPMPKGVFVAPGLVFSPALMRSTNFPQSFVYGTYRVRLFLTKNNEAYGCVIFVCEVKRLWEAE